MHGTHNHAFVNFSGAAHVDDCQIGHHSTAGFELFSTQSRGDLHVVGVLEHGSHGVDQYADDRVVADASKPHLGFVLGARRGNQHDGFTRSHHFADIFGKSPTEAHIARTA